MWKEEKIPLTLSISGNLKKYSIMLNLTVVEWQEAIFRFWFQVNSGSGSGRAIGQSQGFLWNNCAPGMPGTLTAAGRVFRACFASSSPSPSASSVELALLAACTIPLKCSLSKAAVLPIVFHRSSLYEITASPSTCDCLHDGGKLWWNLRHSFLCTLKKTGEKWGAVCWSTWSLQLSDIRF